jgi:hypothetical protein
VEGPVRAHGHGCPERIDALGSASGECEDVFDFQRAFALAEADGLLDRELIERVEGVLDAGGFDAGLGLVDPGFDLSSVVRITSELLLRVDNPRTSWYRVIDALSSGPGVASEL